MSLGFIYQCFNEDLSLFNCLKGVREHYPDAPIYLMSDGGGNDYSDVAKYFNCKYVQYLENVNPHFQRDEENIPKELNIKMYLAYLCRMKDALSYLNTDYVLRLEDDVRCSGKIWHIPKFDVIGPFNTYYIFDEVTNHYINYARGSPYNKEKDKIYSYNCGGGSIFKRTSFLEYINHVLENTNIVYYLYDLNPRNLKDEAIADGVGLLFFGYTMGRSFNIADGNSDISSLSKHVSIMHHYKKDYGKKCDLDKLAKMNNPLMDDTHSKMIKHSSSVKDMTKKYEKSIKK